MTDPTTGDNDSTPAAGAQPDAATTAQPGPSSVETAAPVDELAQARAERDRARDAMLRALADLDNYRKRARRDADDAAKRAREDLLRELLPVFDNLDRALAYVDGGADPKAIGKGIEMVVRLFEDTLARVGGKRLRVVGQPFDPSQQEAIQQIESDVHPAGVVTHEEVAGYLLNDRLLRPAMVVVSKGTPGGTGGSDGGSAPPS